MNSSATMGSGLLESKPVVGPRIKRGKNLICFFIGLFILALASIFIVSRFYANSIKESLEDYSLLRDNSFKLWGTENNPDHNVYQKSFKLFNYTGDTSNINIDENKFSFVEIPFVFNNTFEYAGATFAQGNVGEITFNNKWKLVQKGNPAPFAIQNLNLAYNKIFSSLSQEALQRKFPILFNSMVESMKQQFLPQFYTNYLFEFFYKNKNLVVDTVIKPLNLTKEVEDRLMNDTDYGWKTPEGLQSWMKMCLSGDYDTPTYSQIKSKIGLDGAQMKKLIGKTSTMYHLTMALNGTIKSKLQMGSADINYECKEDVCSDDELVGSQWAISFLTKNELFVGIQLDKTAKMLNSTYEMDIEFSEFCKNNGRENPLTVAGAIPLLSDPQINLRRISSINYLMQNIDSPDVIEQHFNVPGAAQDLTDYVTKYFYKDLILDGLSDQKLAWAWLTYQNFNERFVIFKRFLLRQYLSRAMSKAFGGFTCQDYFNSTTLSKYADMVCSNSEFNITNGHKSYFQYIDAYFYDGRKQFRQAINMSQDDTDFLFTSPQSLFAIQITQILRDLSQHYNCQSSICTDKELSYRQWGEGSILSRLPSKYFDVPSATLLSWDTENIFKKTPTEIYLRSGDMYKYEETKLILSYDGTGILGLFSLLKRLRMNDLVIVDYLNYVLIGQQYGGLIVSKTSNEYLLGYSDQFLQKQLNRNIIEGGKPWEKPIAQLILLNNSQQLSLLDNYEQSKMNTGIYDQKKLRNWKAVNGHYKTGFKTIVDQDENGTTMAWIDTGRPINGTNLLGFHTYVKNDETLQVFMQNFRRTMDLKYVQTVQRDKYSLLRFKWADRNKDIFVGDETLDNKYISITENSYVDIEATTGLTFNLELHIVHKTMPGSILLKESGKIPLYQESVVFERNNLERYDYLAEGKKQSAMFSMISIIVASVSLFLVIVMTFLVCKWSKNLIKLQDGLSFESQIIHTDEEGTKKRSQIDSMYA